MVVLEPVNIEGLLISDVALVANLLEEEKRGIVSEALLFVSIFLVVICFGCVRVEEVRVVMVEEVISGLVLEVTTRRVPSDKEGMLSDFRISTFRWEADTNGEELDLVVQVSLD